ncbi:hypothetical protein [Mesorhizobium sp.]|uniref:hypothetical protein n=1 Tax=Mesorhizobium sp. TaxID=1871066 RepID=UPI000FE8F657|nr:hypothetical protein [Mesorhizobium sp.]RWK58892.1 MAG: hypothetical protein EOR49_29250 [Mesorhizobium sp.]RWM42969.1 MAG: hypothetical protein EOR76_31905 [Mesorhizobium sp.]RWM46364.1 MAG: hypothetical protein EOR78_32820 [Mesorhizobium sp.]RWM54560.1 MAG: hypothetical protein EOR79_23755 [Mesorhizobium sp.]RWM89815.1 MAG: hypothetical protein EOR85_32095 [Mesorhizobium sp.]
MDVQAKVRLAKSARDCVPGRQHGANGGLRRAVKRGQLAVETIGKRYYTTLENIKEIRRLSREGA